MTERVYLGNLGASYGLKISKPGVSVGSATDSQLLLDTSSSYTRVIQMGQLVFSSGGVTTVGASIPSIGGSTPCVLFKYVEIFNGSAYVFPLYRNENNQNTTTTNVSNGRTATASSTSVSVTRNFSSSNTNYVYYFVLSLAVI